jgi:hypothetical protein
MSQYTPLSEGRDVSYKPYDDQDGGDMRRSSSSEDDLFLEKSQALQMKQPFYRRHYRSILTHILLLTCNLVLCFGVWQWSKQDCPYGVYGPDLAYSKLFSSTWLYVYLTNGEISYSTSKRCHSI